MHHCHLAQSNASSANEYANYSGDTFQQLHCPRYSANGIQLCQKMAQLVICKKERKYYVECTAILTISLWEKVNILLGEFQDDDYKQPKDEKGIVVTVH